MDDGVLDAETQRELERLRRRAYGPDADILSDPVAAARLASLETRAHAPVRPADAERTDAAARLIAPERTGRAIPPPAPPRVVRRPRRRLRRRCTGVRHVRRDRGGPRDRAPVAATPEAGIPHEIGAFTRSAATRVLARIPFESTLRGASGASEPGGAPAFPTDDPLLWLEPIGQYFGTRVWIARTVTGRSCVLVELIARDRAKCVDAEHFDATTLLVTVPFSELAPSARPYRMTETESLGIWWRPDRPIELLVGPTPRAP